MSRKGNCWDNAVAESCFSTLKKERIKKQIYKNRELAVAEIAHYIDTFYIPFWVVLSAHAAIGLGTLAGGWRIIHTMGSKITKLQPVGGFAAETSAAISILIATQTGVPVSTTHAITGAMVGVGAVRRLSAVRWGVAGQIVWAWILTIPAAFFIAAAAFALLRMAGAH